MPADDGAHKLVIGLVGQVCSGKSAVARAFARRGAGVYDADKLVHEIYRRPEAIAQVRELFGDEVLEDTGKVDRKALAQIVFSDAGKLKMLTEQVIFPRTLQALKDEIERLPASPASALVLDAPTLFEAGQERLCDRVLFISAPLERRRIWARGRGWADGEVERREASMQNEAEKRRRCDVLLDNAGTLDDVDRQVGELFERWRTSAAPPAARN